MGCAFFSLVGVLGAHPFRLKFLRGKTTDASHVILRILMFFGNMLSDFFGVFVVTNGAAHDPRCKVFVFMKTTQARLSHGYRYMKAQAPSVPNWVACKEVGFIYL